MSEASSILGAAKRANGLDQAAPLSIVRPSELEGLPVPRRRWIVPDWVPVGVVTGLYGRGGTGKSLLAMQLMTAAALARPWVGVPVDEPVPSLGVFCEDDLDELHRRQSAVNGALHAGAGDDIDRPSLENVFLAILSKMVAEGQAVSHNSRAGNYAPKMFASRPERCGYKRADFERAMQSLFSMGEIKIDQYGKPSDGTKRIVRANAAY